ncbi:MAG: hypothetical protein IT353_15075 [Gemmatimonadaceae bacterium]|nr:hypothetical protein [Gemmatimonadaceae bacterium]
MQTLLLVSGLFLLVGGAGCAWVAASQYRSGKHWRGQALYAGASLLYSGVVFSGIFRPTTALAAALIAVVAVLMWTGLFVTLREQRKAAAGRRG